MLPVREASVALQGRELARVRMAPRGAVEPDELLGLLGDADRNRLQGLTRAERREEFVISRALRDELLSQSFTHCSISHCDAWIAVAGAHAPIGFDVETRLPRHVEAVSERLGWPSQQAEERLQAWTLWEASRKLIGGSVLDRPDRRYRAVLRMAPSLYANPQRIEGAVWWSLSLDPGIASVALDTA